MREVQLGNGHFLLCGNVTKDAELRYVGKNDTPLLSFSVFGEKTQNGVNIYYDCKAWRTLAGQLMELKKGDAFCGIARKETREGSSKTFTDYVLVWGNSPALGGSFEIPPIPAAEDGQAVPGTGFTDAEDDAELPF